MATPLLLRAGLGALLAAALLSPAAALPPADVHDVVSVRDAQLDAGYWIGKVRARDRDRVVLDRDAIATRNATLLRSDPTIHDLENLPGSVEAEEVRAMVEKRSVLPDRALYDVTGKQGSPRALARLSENLGITSIPQTQLIRFGLVIRRADLRTFPSRLEVYDAPGDIDLDRFQETALFPGTPVAIVHESRDRMWYFVIAPNYAAWIEKTDVAVGERAAVFEYVHATPSVVVTGATVRTAYTPQKPALSSLQLDMGVRLPRAVDWDPDTPVNGQHPYASWVVRMPVRTADGDLQFGQALLPRSADVSPDVLPLTRANLLRQSFKFLGERYGWGHSFDTRDCSGFVAEVYRSFGLQMPRNTGDQATSPAFDRLAFGAGDDHASRLRALRATQVGDLVYVPGHVMMVIGHEDGLPYVIHDVAGIRYRLDDGSVHRVLLNGVAVTPLVPLLAGDDTPMVDRITAIQRIR